MRNTKILFMIVVLFWSGLAFSNKKTIVKYGQTGSRYEYQIKLLELVLKKTVDSDGSFALEDVPIEGSKNRVIKFFEEGKFDVMWLGFNQERYEKFSMVNIPILKGLLGHRVLLIRKDRTRDFADVKTLKDLQTNFVAGFGAHWADLPILKSNGLRVIENPKYENIFKMLMVGRFDFFPRGVDEAWLEVEERKSMYPELVVEPSLGLYYSFPYYFFVRKGNSLLASRIERGLRLVEEDGSFRKLFLKYFSRYIEQADLKNRRIFKLKNPNLPKEIAIPDTTWWLSN